MKLSGAFTPPGDKSISHRLVLMSIIARGRVRATNLSPCADVNSSIGAARALGADIRRADDAVIINGLDGRVAAEAAIDCGNSGTSMRLLMGILAGRPGRFTLDGDESLRRRPMERVAGPVRLMGARADTTDGRAPVTLSGGGLHGIDYDLPVASAQVKSAVLLAGLQASGSTTVREPAPSRDHTERMILLFGGRLTSQAGVLTAEPSSLNLTPDFYVPGDSSSAAFFLCAAAITPGSSVTAEGMMLNPTRIGFIEVLKRMGADMEIEVQSEEPETWGRCRVDYTPRLTGCDIRGEEIPLLVDEVPILALVAARAHGATVFHDVGELRHKESDRLAAVTEQLGRLGAKVRIDGDRLVVDGPGELKPSGELDSYGDHRMAMMLRLALFCSGETGAIRDEDCAGVSYPDFHEELARLTA